MTKVGGRRKVVACFEGQNAGPEPHFGILGILLHQLLQQAMGQQRLPLLVGVDGLGQPVGDRFGYLIAGVGSHQYLRVWGFSGVSRGPIRRD